MPAPTEAGTATARSSIARRSMTKRRDTSRQRAAVPEPEVLPEAVAYLGGKQRAANRRAKCCSRFDELAQLICSARTAAPARNSLSPLLQTTSGFAAAAPPSGRYAFPTLQVGYLARALGLNVSNQQVAAVVELVESDGPSTGFVDSRLLRLVLVDAMITGTLGGPTLRSSAAAGGPAPAVDGESVEAEEEATLSEARLESFVPSLCVRDDEATLLRAFSALDKDQRGFLVREQVRSFMTEGDDALSVEEAEEMWMAMHDPTTNRAYYIDFADVLTRE